MKAESPNPFVLVVASRMSLEDMLACACPHSQAWGLELPRQPCSLAGAVGCVGAAWPCLATPMGMSQTPNPERSLACWELCEGPCFNCVSANISRLFSVRNFNYQKPQKGFDASGWADLETSFPWNLNGESNFSIIYLQWLEPTCILTAHLV